MSLADKVIKRKESPINKCLIALSEGRFLREVYNFIRKKLLQFCKCIDELLGVIFRALLLGGEEIIDNRIVFATFQNTYTCNCKYIAEEMIAQDLNYELIFIVSREVYENRNSYNIPAQVQLVKRNSIESYLAISSAHFWIDNALNIIWKKIFKKRGQIYINTWHGSLGIKRLNGNRHWRHVAKTGNKLIDYFVTNSIFEENVFNTSFWPDVKHLKFGHARNDIFFDKNKMMLLKEKVYKYYNIDLSSKTVLYAPTFRDNKSDVSAIRLDCELLKKSLKERWGGKWVILIRTHFHNSKNPIIRKMYDNKEGWVINAAQYPDIQELMAAVDVGITDYSSWIFDFALSRKPAFIYAEDIDQYIQSRGFYYPLNETPFLIANNSQKLADNILTFDLNTYEDNLDLFMKEKGCYEQGNASMKIVEFICKNTSIK